MAVLVNLDNFKQYSGGIITNCGWYNQVNHLITLVGYGTYNNIQYWRCKNSYGTNWGEKGYVRLVRNMNMCGIAQSVTIITNQ